MDTSVTGAPLFAALFAALYVAHHVGDYWVQTNHQAQRKALPGKEGRLACFGHVSTYVATQAFFLIVVRMTLDLPVPTVLQTALALGISGVTHYLADRRKPLERLARLLQPYSGKLDFYRMGSPRPLKLVAKRTDGAGTGEWAPLDAPTLATGAWALDQSWHLVFSVLIPALILAS